MPAQQHLLLGVLGTRDHGHHVVHALLLIGDVEVEPRLGGSRPDVILEGQASLEGLGRRRTAERPQHRLGVAVGDRRGGDARQIGRVRGIEPRSAGNRGRAGGERVARVFEDVLDAAALDAVGVLPGAVGEDRALHEAVVLGVGVDDQALGALLLRDLGLHTAEALAVANEHDLARDVDAELLERLVVVGQAVVRVDELAGHVARRRVGVVADHDLVVVALPGEARLLIADLALVGRSHRHLDAVGARDVDVVGGTVRIEPVAPEGGEREVEGVAVARGADQLGAPAERAAEATDRVGGDGVLEALLGLGLLGRAFRREAGDRCVLRTCRGGDGSEGGQGDRHQQSAHARVVSGAAETKPRRSRAP